MARKCMFEQVKKYFKYLTVGDSHISYSKGYANFQYFMHKAHTCSICHMKKHHFSFPVIFLFSIYSHYKINKSPEHL